MISVLEVGWAPGPTPLEAPQRIDKATRYAYQRINGRSVLASVDGPLPGAADTTVYQWDARADYTRQITYPHQLRHSIK